MKKYRIRKGSFIDLSLRVVKALAIMAAAWVFVVLFCIAFGG